MISLLISLVIIGVVFYFINLIPMQAPMPQIVQAVMIILAVVLVIQFLGVALPFKI